MEPMSRSETANVSSPRNNAAGAASLTQHAYDQLRDALLNCRFESGEPLRIGELQKSLDASQGAVREALSRLTSEGLVQARPQRGFRVTPISAADFRDLTAARIEIEEICLRHAIETGDVRWEARIVAAFHQLSRTAFLEPRARGGCDRRLVALHHSFLDVLVSSPGSFWLARVRQMLQVQEFRYYGRLTSFKPAERDLVGELREVMEAVIARDAARASQLLVLHMRRTADLLLAQLGD
jgi:DNA-binding GntR family transcriptional regulator